MYKSDFVLWGVRLRQAYGVAWGSITHLINTGAFGNVFDVFNRPPLPPPGECLESPIRH